MRPMIDYYPILIIPLGEILRTKISYKKYIINFILGGFCSPKFISNVAKRNGVIHWDSMSKESYWAFLQQLKWRRLKTGKEKKVLLKSPDYNKARRGRKSTSLTFYKLSFTLTGNV